jgi:hypothetical protein
MNHVQDGRDQVEILMNHVQNGRDPYESRPEWWIDTLRSIDLGVKSPV